MTSTLTRTGRIRRKTPFKTRSRLRPIGEKGKRNRWPDTQWRAAVLLRDRHVCIMRGWTGHRCFGDLEAHHIYCKQTHPKLRHVLANGVTLCWTGHYGYAHHHVAEARHAFLARLNPEEFAEVQSLL